ncbi:hypothetical protein EDD86DRAFT_247076 [Gorgonomyces haynaldii]|nr:hypothetical protein EDD86DRAFT_247076 [Gorgonomyces haynaldii]
MLLEKRDALLETCQSILKDLETIKAPKESINRFRNMILREVKFLGSLNEETIKPSYVQCSNVTHLLSIFQVLQAEEGIVGICQTFTYDKSVKVDVVSGYGLRWIKVRAQLPRMDEEFSESEDDSPQLLVQPTHLEKQMKQMLMMSHRFPVNYKVPSVILKFLTPPDTRTENNFRQMDVQVEWGTERVIQEEILQPILNLDVNTLVAMASELSHTKDIPDHAFDNIHLKQQREHEMEAPLWPKLQQLFQERQLLTTRDALDRFGPTEFARAVSLFPEADILKSLKRIERLESRYRSANRVDFPYRVQVVENAPSERFVTVSDAHRKNGNCRLKPMHVNIFGTGDHLNATTVTANAWIKGYLSSLDLQNPIILTPYRILLIL